MNNLFNTKASKIGSIVIAASLILLAILMLFQFVMGALPKSATLLDLSANKMYSINDTSKRDIAKTSEKVNIYLLTAGGEDMLDDSGVHLNNFLQRACALNKKISYTVVDLYTDTEFITEKGLDSANITLNSIVVESEKRNRYIDSSDIFYYHIDGIGKVSQSEAQLYQMYYGLTPIYQFAGEGLLVSAIKFVTSDTLPLVTALTGHGETALSETLKNEFTKAGAAYSEIAELSLVPGCELIVINAPTGDISAAEADILEKYLNGGGKLAVITGPSSSAFTNLSALLESRGLGNDDGIIIEQNTSSYYQYPYFLIPTVNTSVIESEQMTLLVAYAHGIALDLDTSYSVSTLLTTSASAYIIPTTASAIEKPEGADEKDFAVGAISTDEENGSSIIWFSSQLFLDESANQQVGGGNYAYMSDVVKYACGSSDNFGTATAPLTLVTERITISNSVLSIVSILLVIALPATILALGGAYCYKRRRK